MTLKTAAQLFDETRNYETINLQLGWYPPEGVSLTGKVITSLDLELRVQKATCAYTRNPGRVDRG